MLGVGPYRNVHGFIASGQWGYRMIIALLAQAVASTVTPALGMELDRDQALAYIEQLARDEGLPTVTGVGWFKPGGNFNHSGTITGCWSFDLQLENKDHLEGELTPGGMVERFFLVDKAMPPTPYVREPMKSPELVTAAWKLLKPMHPQGDVRLDDIEHGSLGFTAEFSVRINGHRFFNLNPTYGYRLWFDWRSNSVLQYLNAEPPTPVNAASPRVTEQSAETKLMQLCRDLGRGLFDPKSPWPVYLRMELGYFKFQKEASARLVWRGFAVETLPDAHEQECGATSHFVDALNGEMIKSDDGGMGGFDYGEPKVKPVP